MLKSVVQRLSQLIVYAGARYPIGFVLSKDICSVATAFDGIEYRLITENTRNYGYIHDFAIFRDGHYVFSISYNPTHRFPKIYIFSISNTIRAIKSLVHIARDGEDTLETYGHDFLLAPKIIAHSNPIDVNVLGAMFDFLNIPKARKLLTDYIADNKSVVDYIV